MANTKSKVAGAFLVANTKLTSDSSTDEDIYGIYSNLRDAIADAKDVVEEDLIDDSTEKVQYVYKLVPVKVVRGKVIVVEEAP